MPNSAAPLVIAAIRKGRGPNLQGVFGKPVLLEDGRIVTADENYLRESILDPGAKVVKGFKPVMPTFQGLVSEEQVNALVAYVKSFPATNRGGSENQRQRGCSASPPATSSATEVRCNEYGYSNRSTR